MRCANTGCRGRATLSRSSSSRSSSPSFRAPIILKLHSLLESLVLHDLLHLRARLSVQVDSLQLLPSRISDDELRVMVLNPLHLDVPVLLPLLVLLQPLLQVPVVGLVQGSARAGLKPPVRRRVGDKGRLGDPLIVAAAGDLLPVRHDGGHHAVLVDRAARNHAGAEQQQAAGSEAAHRHAPEPNGAVLCCAVLCGVRGRHPPATHCATDNSVQSICTKKGIVCTLQAFWILDAVPVPGVLKLYMS